MKDLERAKEVWSLIIALICHGSAIVLTWLLLLDIISFGWGSGLAILLFLFAGFAAYPENKRGK